MTALIETLIDSPDPFELVRDMIATILVEESENQVVLAAAAGADPEEYRLRVYTEHGSPWEEFLDDDDEPRSERTPNHPIVNVWVDRGRYERNGSTPLSTKWVYTYHLDVYAMGLSRAKASGGHVEGSRESALNAQRAARLARRVLSAGHYVYLLSPRGGSQFVWRREFTEVQFFQPQAGNRTLQRLSAARMMFDVEMTQPAPEAVAQVLERITATVRRESLTGPIYLRAQYPDPT